jgi:NAD(P)H-hydrate epimerase
MKVRNLSYNLVHAGGNIVFVVTNREMREIDRYTMEQIGIPSAVLMENAGKSIADWIVEHIKGKSHVGVVCGKGNNGGDGLVIARHLHNYGLLVKVIILGKPEDLSIDSALQYAIVCNIGIDVDWYDDTGGLQETHFKNFDLIIDAMLGTGTKGVVRQHYQQAIQSINLTRTNNDNVMVISVDNPTGVFGDYGEVVSDTIVADITLTLGYMKQALLNEPARRYAGKLVTIDFGIPRIAEQAVNLNKRLITEQLVKKWLPKRVQDSHKGTYGKVHCIAGSHSYFGAGLLAATASLHIGAGLVYWDAPEVVSSMWCAQTPELIFKCHSSENGHFAMDSVASLSAVTKDADAVVMGCGIMQFDNGEQWLATILSNIKCPVVLDADGFVMLADHLDVLNKYQGSSPIVVTPHPGEFAKVLGISVSEVEANRMELAMQFAKEHQVIVVLKGSQSIIAAPEGQLYINTTGNHVLAKGGTGDVLAGFVGGLIGQGISPIEAACVAVYVHGLTAEHLSKNKYVSTMASDVSRSVGAVLQNLATRA